MDWTHITSCCAWCRRFERFIGDSCTGSWAAMISKGSTCLFLLFRDVSLCCLTVTCDGYCWLPAWSLLCTVVESQLSTSPFVIFLFLRLTEILFLDILPLEFATSSSPWLTIVEDSFTFCCLPPVCSAAFNLIFPFFFLADSSLFSALFISNLSSFRRAARCNWFRRA